MKPLAVLVCAVVATLGEVSGADLVLVKDGRPAAQVVLGPGASADEREAARELVDYIRRATGATLPTTGLKTKILVGLAACPPHVRARLAALKGEGFIIEASTDRLILAGKPPQGTSFAVYTFLERFLGVRWLWPGEIGTVVPKTMSLRVPTLSIVEQPAFLWRHLGPGGALWGPADRWTKQRELGITAEHQATQKLWEKRNRFGGLRVQSGHNFGNILPPAKYGPVHPEYFALVDGKRGDWRRFDGKHNMQPCTTNPDVIQLTVAYCRRYFTEHPDYDVVSIGMNDGRGFCECDRCRRLDSGATLEEGKGGKLPVITDRIVTFGNQVAEELAKTHPRKMVLMLAYGQARPAPLKVKAHPHLLVQYTSHLVNHWNEKARQADYAEAEKWSRWATQLGIYEYLIQSRFPEMPRFVPELIARSVRHLYQLGYRYFETQAGDGFAINGLNYYVLSKVLWNPAADPGLIVRDYVEKGFGKAGPAVARYFERMAEQWKKAADVVEDASMLRPTLAEYRLVRSIYPEEFLAACRRDLQEAHTLAEGDDRRRVEFLQAGFRYFELTMEAITKTIPLLAAGWDLSQNVSAPPSPDMRAFSQALAAWEERERYVASVKNDFVVDYLWIRYNDLMTGFVPLERMRAWRP